MARGFWLQGDGGNNGDMVWIRQVQDIINLVVYDGVVSISLVNGTRVDVARESFEEMMKKVGEVNRIVLP